MAQRRTIEVKALTRVEGEGALYAVVDGDTVERVELNIYEPPRFFESLLRGRRLEDAPDITARICGICPVAYQMSACHAMEKALGVEVTPEIATLRRLFYCGEWIESHALHMFMLHLPDFLGYDSAISMAADHRELVEDALRIKKTGNRLLEAIGGRAVHPVNTAVGGFYRAPRVEELRALLPELQWGLRKAQEAVELVSRLDFSGPDLGRPFVSLRDAHEYPMNHGRVASSDGLDIDVAEYERHFEERQVPHSTALHSVLLPAGVPYVVGPLARTNVCFDRLSPAAKRAAEDCGVAWPARKSCQSIVARAVELVHAFDVAVGIVDEYRAAPGVARVEYEPRDAVGMHATEAPRGLLYHRYRIEASGDIVEAKIVPPTSQNQAPIEGELRRVVAESLDAEDHEISLRCERLIRHYDPCISCATHFLKLTLERR